MYHYVKVVLLFIVFFCIVDFQLCHTPPGGTPRMDLESTAILHNYLVSQYIEALIELPR